MKENFKVMILSPIGKYLLLDQDGIDKNFEKAMREIYSKVLEKTNNVAFSLEREQYGKNRMWGDVCTQLDFKDVKESDFIVAFPENSGGVAVELGWASAMGKEILVFVDEHYRTSELIKFIHLVTPAKIVKINTNNGYEPVMEKIKFEIDDYFKNKI